MKTIMALGIAFTLSTGNAYAYDNHKEESGWQNFWSSLFSSSHRHGGNGMCS